MQADDEKILRIAKEIIVKFIELGRVSTTNFDDHFRSVFWTIKDTVINSQLSTIEPGAPAPAKDDSEDSDS